MNLINKLAVNSKTSNVKGNNVELYVSKCQIKDKTMSLSFCEDLNTLDLVLEYRALSNKIDNAKRKNKKDVAKLEALKTQLLTAKYVYQTVYINQFKGGKTPTDYQAYFATPKRAMSMVENFFMKFIELGDDSITSDVVAVATPYLEQYKTIAEELSTVYDTFDGMKGEDGRLPLNDYKLFKAECDRVNTRHMNNIVRYFKALAEFLSENKLSATFSVADGHVKAFKK